MHNTKIIPVAIFLDIVHTWHYCTETKKGRREKGRELLMELAIYTLLLSGPGLDLKSFSALLHWFW